MTAKMRLGQRGRSTGWWVVAAVCGVWTVGSASAEAPPAVAPQLGFASGATRIAFSPDGRWLAALGEGATDKVVKIWDRATNLELLTLSTGEKPTELAFSKDGTKLVVASGDATRLFDTNTWQF